MALGFNSYHNGSTNPAKAFHKWAGGKGELVHWNGEENVASKLPFKFAILEQTRRIQGFVPGRGQGDSARFYSNEAVDYNDVITVMRKEQNKAAEEVISGKYADIKSKLPEGAKYASVLYILNVETGEIECLTLSGCSVGAFIDFSKKNKIYENFVEITGKGEEEHMGASTFYRPVFAVSDPYSREDMDMLVKKDAEVIDWLKEVHNKSGATSSDPIDQTPAQYDGEGSQEIIEEEPSQDNNKGEVDFSSIPF